MISDEFPDGVVPDDADVSHYMHVTNIVNTKISYLYRDASNYKAYNEVIIKGKISPEQINQIMECLDDGEYFIPCQIGFPEIRIGKVDPEVDPVGLNLKGVPLSVLLNRKRLIWQQRNWFRHLKKPVATGMNFYGWKM